MSEDESTNWLAHFQRKAIEESGHLLSDDELSGCRRYLSSIPADSPLAPVCNAILSLLLETENISGDYGSNSVPAKELYDIYSWRLQRDPHHPFMGHKETVDLIRQTQCAIRMDSFGCGHPRWDVNGWSATLFVDADTDQLVGAILFRPEDYTN